ncbi:MAG: urea transporter [Gammaproteobacteria bacterium]|nr:urea transporter [Gammaproteobacteria bacterium]
MSFFSATWPPLWEALKIGIEGILRAYASILFANRLWVGGLFLLATFWFSNIGLAGLLAVVVGLLSAQLLRFANLSSGLHLYNSLLVGLSLGAVYQLDQYLTLLIVLGAVLAVFLTVAVSDFFWRLGRLPALSLPFVVVALTTAFSAQSYGNLSHYLTPLAPIDTFVNPFFDNFLIALGSAFFSPHPLAGLILFVGLLITSRYLALLALAGFSIGHWVFVILTGDPNPTLVAWAGFNFILTAMALGGVFVIPSWAAFFLALVGAALAALLTAATQSMLLLFGLSVMAIPFLLTTFTLLMALQHRQALAKPWLLLERPDLPEKNYERSRLAQVRNGGVASLPLVMPLMGACQIYQGFNGRFTHKAPWQHALDFFVTEGGKSYRANGKEVEHYFVFGLPVLAPIAGQVVRCVSDVADNAPGEVNTKRNWGNFILLRTTSGLHVMLAHLRQNSLKVEEGQWLQAGEVIAACGNSGRSPQPHLHLQVQATATLGAATVPFHLSSVLLKRDNATQFCTSVIPVEAETVQAAVRDARLATPLHLPVGRFLTYQVNETNTASLPRRLQVDLSLDGRLTLISDQQASSAFEELSGVLAFYDREGEADAFLDLWLLALGLTPFSSGSLQWSDRPSLALLPLSRWQKLFCLLRYPLGHGLQSTYCRHWDSKKEVWFQLGEHRLPLWPGKTLLAKSSAMIKPNVGCCQLSLQMDQYCIEAQLQGSGLTADEGIPGWEQRI